MATQSHTDVRAGRMVDSIILKMPEASLRVEEDFRLYLESGICSFSGFYLALVENNLWQAHRRADAKNLERLDEWLSWMYWHFPAKAWGGPEAIRDFEGIAAMEIPEQNRR